MVTIVEAVIRKNSNGETFTVLILASGVEMVKSQKGKLYATCCKASVPCTLSLEHAKTMLGQKMPGSIIRKVCDPYQYTTQSGEVIELDFTYEYNEQGTSTEEALFH